jgi:hypothetical protein
LQRIEAEAAHDFLRVQLRRTGPGIQLEAVSSRDRRKFECVEIFEEVRARRHLALLDPIRIAHPVSGLFSRAVQEHRQQFAAMPLQDGFEIQVLRQVFRLGVAEVVTTSATPCPAAVSKAVHLTRCTSSQNPGAPNSNTLSARSIAA